MLMLNLPHPIPKREIENHTWICDLQYFEGPLVSLFKASQREDFVYLWVDSDEYSNRWMAFSVKRSDLINYKNKDKTLKQIIDEKRHVYLVDINGEGDVKQAFWIKTDELSIDYMPAVDSHFCAELCQDQGALEIPSNFSIQIDSEWYFDDFSELERKFSQVYSFIYSLIKLNTGSVNKMQAVYKQFPWKGGFSSVNFFEQIRTAIPSYHEVRVSKLQYASPGAITLTLDSKVAQRASALIEACFRNELLVKSYKNSVKLLTDYKILSSPELYDTLDENAKKEISSALGDLQTQMGLGDMLFKWSSLPENPAYALKILQAIYRRITSLNSYQTAGRVKGFDHY
jgi:flagellin-specific chaperone FliS